MVTKSANLEKMFQKSAKMALFAAVAPGGEVRRAFRGARVDEHIRAGYHADAGAREAPRRRTRPADARSFWASFSLPQRCQWRPPAVKMTPKTACVGRPSASTSRFQGTGVGVVPSGDVFVDARAADSAPHLPPGRRGGKHSHFRRFLAGFCFFADFVLINDLETVAPPPFFLRLTWDTSS